MIWDWELRVAHFLGETTETAARTYSDMPKHLGQGKGSKRTPLFPASSGPVVGRGLTECKDQNQLSNISINSRLCMGGWETLPTVV